MKEKSSVLKTFTWPIRVYYEDTDAAGVVYYASYLRFFERCRTEWLRFIGYDQAKLMDEHHFAFVVRAISAEYLKPGRLDDQLDCHLTVEKVSHAKIVFHQEIRRQSELLVVAQVKIACVDTCIMKPTPMPAWLRQNLENTE